MENQHKGAVGFDVWELSKIFDRDYSDGDSVRVVAGLPDDIRLSEMSILSHDANGMTKATYTRGKCKYLVVMNTKEYTATFIDRITLIKKNPDWHERWSIHEISGSDRPLLKLARILKSRLKNNEERDEWNLFYGDLK